MSIKIEIIKLGYLEYSKCYDVQQTIYKEVLDSLRSSTVIFVEHPPVLTLGKNVVNSDITVSRKVLMEAEIEVVKTDRGGLVTAHEPGQLVVYPIIRFSDFKFGPKRFVKILESSLIKLLEQYEIVARGESNNPGVWVKEKKIASIGIRVKEKVSYHGLSLNILNSLKLFRFITPCGIKNCTMTSMSLETRKELNISKLIDEFFVLIRQELLEK